jgi:glycosyltransferase involved in cell wall biosynthesis
MKILIATGLYPPQSGGPATYSKLLNDELPKRGVGVIVLPFSSVRLVPKIFRHALYFFKCFKNAIETEIVYALDPVSVGLPASLAALLLRKKFILRVAGDYAWEQGRQRFGVTDELDAFQNKKYGWQVELLRMVQKFVAHRAKTIIVPSEYMRLLVSKWISNPQKVETIHSSVHIPPAYELPQDRPEGFLIVTIARRVPWKGIEALERVIARESSWTFKLLDDLPHKEAMGWVKTADVFALNSTYEGLSHALIEAMSLGTPIVATNAGGNPELIANGSEGLIIPPKDDVALYTALKEIEEHPDEARARAERAKERSKQFSIAVTFEQLVHLLKTL